MTNYINKIKKGELSMEHKMKALNTHCKNKYEKILRERHNAQYIKHQRIPQQAYMWNPRSTSLSSLEKAKREYESKRHSHNYVSNPYGNAQNLPEKGKEPLAGLRSSKSIDDQNKATGPASIKRRTGYTNFLMVASKKPGLSRNRAGLKTANAPSRTVYAHTFDTSASPAPVVVKLQSISPELGQTTQPKIVQKDMQFPPAKLVQKMSDSGRKIISLNNWMGNRSALAFQPQEEISHQLEATYHQAGGRPSTTMRPVDNKLELSRQRSKSPGNSKMSPPRRTPQRGRNYHDHFQTDVHAYNKNYDMWHPLQQFVQNQPDPAEVIIRKTQSPFGQRFNEEIANKIQINKSFSQKQLQLKKTQRIKQINAYMNRRQVLNIQ